MLRRNLLFCKILTVVHVSLATFTSADDLTQDLRDGIGLARVAFENLELAGKVSSKSNPDLVFPFKLPIDTSFLVVGTEFCLADYKEKSGLRLIHAANDRYAFTLSKPAGARQFSLSYLYSRDDPNGVEPITLQRQGLDNFLFPHYQIKFHWLWDALEDPGFKIVSIKKINAGEHEFVKIVFSFEPKQPRLSSLGFDRPFVGYFICDPARMWAITESFIKDEEESPYGAMRYMRLNDDSSNLPMPTRVIYFGASGNISQETSPTMIEEWKEIGSEQIEISFDETAIDTNAFYLTHYGLPEPEFSRSTIGPWLIYVLSGAICMLIGTMIYRKSRMP